MSNKVIKYWQLGTIVLIAYMLTTLLLYRLSIGLVAFAVDCLICLQSCILLYILQKVKVINNALEIFSSKDPNIKNTLNENSFKGWDNWILIYILISMCMGVTFTYKWTPKALSLHCVILLNFIFLLYIVKNMFKITISILEEKEYDEEI